MAGLHSQSKRKADARRADMSPTEPAEPHWLPPPGDECEEAELMTFPLGDADPTTDRVKVRMLNHVETSALVEFAVIQETRPREVAARGRCRLGTRR